MKNGKIGIIGGSGLEDPGLLKKTRRIEVKTPYGQPSEKLICGWLNKKQVVILSRHGQKHQFSPTKVPYQANLWALKELGCQYILATTACGSLKEEIKPKDFVFLDQFIDFTRHRHASFFEDFKDGPIHPVMAEPFSKKLREVLIKSAKELHIPYHTQGTVITIEGPRFSTKAESCFFKNMGADVINMSTVPEVILANELKIPYAAIAMTTDYDCWRERTEAVSFEMVMKAMKHNAKKAKVLLLKTIALI